MRPASLALLLPLCVYWVTRAPGLTFIDSGELAAATATLGIAHPTGYPLYTLLGRLASLLPGPGDPATRLTLLSGLCVAAGVLLLAGVIARVLRSAGSGAREAAWIGTAASLTVAFGLTVWQQATIIEVHGLAFLLLALLFDLSTRAVDSDDSRLPILFGFVAGLAVSNHGSSVPLVPVLALPLLRGAGTRTRVALMVTLLASAGVLALQVARPLGVLLLAASITTAVALARRAVVRLLPAAVAGLVALSIYAYLPVRSALAPLLDWGDPQTPGAFWRHITGRVFHVWFFASFDAAIDNAGRFVQLWLREWTVLGAGAALYGAVLHWRRTPESALWVTTVIAVNLIYALNYDIHDIDAYFIPVLVMSSAWLALGVWDLAARLARGAAPAVRMALVAVVPLAAIVANWSGASSRDVHLVQDYTSAMFDSLEPDAVILSRQWDHFCSAALYAQAVRDERPDVTVIEKELLRRRWYLAQLERWAPELMAPCTDRVNAFDAALIPFEEGHDVDAAALQTEFVGMIQCLLTGAERAGRPIYLTPDALEPGIGAGYEHIPVGLAMRLLRERPETAPATTDVDIRGLAEAVHSDDQLEAQLAALVLEMWTRRAIYEASMLDLDGARAGLDRVLALDAEHARARSVRARIDQLEPRLPAAAPPP